MNFEQYSRETPLRLEDAGRMVSRLRASERPAHATVWRWCKRGLLVKPATTASGDVTDRSTRTVRLEYHRIGGRIMTTEQAVWRFLEATQDSGASEPITSPALPTASPRTSRTIDSAKARVESFLASPPRTKANHYGDRGVAPSPGAKPSGRKEQRWAHHHTRP